MKLSMRAKRLLRLIDASDDASVKLTRGWAKAADELKDNELAVFIPRSQGGADVALTQAGIDYAEWLSESSEVSSVDNEEDES